MTDLPIEEVLPGLRRALSRTTQAVLQAPPGAGKTTRVPLALLEERWLEGGKIIMLEPRRLAARAAAKRMSDMLGEEVGHTVGYRVRMDTQVTRATRIEVVTEGVLTRFIQDDPALDGVAAVIFDEYHERSLQADLGLALTLQSQHLLREDLRLLVMSATLDAEPIAALLEEAAVVRSEGRMYPVETHYLPHHREERVEELATQYTLRAVDEEQGSILVFLPGAGEIRRTAERLRERQLPRNVDVFPLYGNLSHQEQDRAVAPSPEGQRKIVLATPIAETSLTIEGIRVVVDSGLMREPHFDPSSGMTRLETVRISHASADQRRGRAGRLGPGVCYRLWTQRTHQHLPAFNAPEIAQADLTPLALNLARWGVADPAALRWLDPPPADTFAQAQDLLHRLGAVDPEGRITAHGRAVAEVPLHPRLAHMVLQAKTLELGGLACELAALLSERDIFKGRGGLPDADLRLRLEALHAVRDGDRPDPVTRQGFVVDHGACRYVLRVARHWRRHLHLPEGAPADVDAAGLLLAFAYPDRLAQRLPGQDDRFRLRNGRIAALSHTQLLSGSDYLVAAHVDERRQEGRIFLAAPLSQDDLETYFGGHIDSVQDVRWEAQARRVVAEERRELGALTLDERTFHEPDPAQVQQALLEGIRDEGLERALRWSKKSRQLQERLVFLHHHFPEEWPAASEEALLASLDEWLGPQVYGMRRLSELQQLSTTELLLGLIDYGQRQQLNALAPTHYEVPSGSRRPIDYSDPEAPVLAVRLQELFGQTTTPRIADGRVPLTLHLLSPAQRPVQVTQDLENFWAETYFDVRKDLRGRYSKHYWPADPLTATPTNRAKPR